MTNPVPPPKSPPAPPAPPRWRRLLRRLLLIAASLLLILAVVFFLIPVWISNDQGRLYVLDRLNARLHGPRVTIDKWSLSWFHASDFQNLSVLQPDGTPILTCPHVSSGITLWDLAWANYDLRNTTADNLDMRIQKNSDGTTSLDSLAAGAGDILRSSRGALQIANGKLTFTSLKTSQSISYNDLKASITIASPDAPFHVQLSALSENAAPLSLNATCPPIQSLSTESLIHPGIWSLLADVDLAASHVPAAMTCDFLGLDNAWVQSLGDSLDTLQFANHPAPPNASHLSLHIRGIPKSGEPASLDARILVHLPDNAGRGTILTVSPATPFSAEASLHLSPPLSKLLGHLNPILGETSSTTPTGLIHMQGSFTLPLDHLSDSTAALRLTFPPLTFTPRDGPSLVRQLQVITGEIPKPTESNHPAGTAGVLLTTLSDGQFSYENFLVTLGQIRINFTGNSALSGNVDLQATVPLPNSGLAAGTSRLVITGTHEAPLLKQAE